jgi:hypothetical protein
VGEVCASYAWSTEEATLFENFKVQLLDKT